MEGGSVAGALDAQPRGGPKEPPALATATRAPQRATVVQALHAATTSPRPVTASDAGDAAWGSRSTAGPNGARPTLRLTHTGPAPVAVPAEAVMNARASVRAEPAKARSTASPPNTRTAAEKVPAFPRRATQRGSRGTGSLTLVPPSQARATPAPAGTAASSETVPGPAGSARGLEKPRPGDQAAHTTALPDEARSPTIHAATIWPPAPVAATAHGPPGPRSARAGPKRPPVAAAHSMPGRAPPER